MDGSVYGQPLYLHGVQVPGKGTRNALCVATMNEKVYALDADRRGSPLRMRNFTAEIAGITPGPITDIASNNNLNIGMEGTLAIDRAVASMYLVR